MHPSAATLARWWLLAAWRMQPGRWAVAALAVACGVAMALAIHLVNASALDEFRDAIARVNGEAQLQVVGRAGGFDEAVWPVVASAPEVAEASPLVEVTAGPVRLLGLDVFRAARVTPALLPRPGERAQAGAASPLFAADTVFMSAAARRRLGDAGEIRDGDTVTLPAGLRRVAMRVAGEVDPGGGDAIAVADIAAVQWHFGLLGRLSRIDLRLDDALPREAARERLLARLRDAGHGDVDVVAPDASAQRMSNLSRAYRVNLSVLALVALFTGAFLVWSALSLAVRRQRPMLALLGVLGLPPRSVGLLVALQGTAVAAAGSLAGAALGVAVARALLLTVGGDLGGGYFAGTASLHADPWAIAGFVALGTAVGALASLAPANATARMAPAAALRDAGGESTPARTNRILGFAAIALALAGAGLLALPPLDGIPVPSYLAIALWLLAGIAAVPALAAAAARMAVALSGTASAASASASVFASAPAFSSGRENDSAAWRNPSAWLALVRIAQAPAQASAAVAGVVASFALGCAMAIMVQSFRDSVAGWLDAVLPADLYLRAPVDGAAGAFDPALQARLRALPGIARVEFLRARELVLDPARPPVALLAREIDPANPAARLPLTGATAEVPADTIAVWVSEPLARRDGIAPGDTLELPLPGTDGVRFAVAGIWRDYARQHGAIVIGGADYRRLTGDATVGDAALWLAPGGAADEAARAARALLPTDARYDLRSAAEIRALSLTVFDRSFAVTYVLEAAAIGVGLVGVAAAFGGQALARRREFGVLRHLGATRGLLLRQIALEAAAIAVLGVAWGGALGAAIAAVLIHRVNPQSFHWTMGWSVPWGLLAATAAALVAAAIVAALAASRHATSDAPVRAVREDW